MESDSISVDDPLIPSDNSQCDSDADIDRSLIMGHLAQNRRMKRNPQ